MPGDDEPRRIGGRYTLSAQLGSGAMGTVWSGYDEVLQRRVAVKELKVPPGIPEHEALAMRERMLREARALGGLSNPNVITVYDVVDIGGEPLVVLELLPSRNLATMIAEQGRLTSRQAAVVGYATAGALRAAHRAGITHRDVKPGNVLVADDGRVKLTDFGIARNAADAPMTTAGLVLGSPAYIAPEVAAGQAVAPAADLWGLGATLFAALEGRPPYDVRGDPVSTITEVVDGEVPRPRDAGPVSEVIAALMVKEPDQRMPLDEVRQRLRPLLADPEDPLYPGSPDSPTVGGAIPHPRPAERSDGHRPTTSSSGWSAPLADAPGPLPIGLGSPPRQVAPGPAPLPTSPGALPGIPLAPNGSPPRSPTGSPSGPPRPAVAPARPVTATGARPARRREPGLPASWAAALMMAGAVIVLLGAAGGWAVTRALAGQSPLTTVTVTTARAALSDYHDPDGFGLGIPATWTRSRDQPPDGTPVVSFVSPGSTEELVVQRAASATAVLDALTPEQLGADDVTVEPAVPVAGAAEGAQELTYRTSVDSLEQRSWLRMVPAGDGVWTIRLTVPAGPGEDISAELFSTLVAGFTPPGA
ncbi:serine/threonine-protein kinase [Pseudonocardia asaccharolytica]|uniref:non-specific serine/threonine protein kinase n=1 Tax=Pseudonocardia asaccharolytica DSM 44247 = NBRC 16224 TaxID=1123024 RepID=A0A511CUM9_9PSEU|nr:serine/threonine-protein kinase [Pseudonocardia asaccharolytica]GEL16167.1 serine/threonine protein kinase [Pseudonocardia asaccharolytica DSM 44247 = NBRC 16224]